MRITDLLKGIDMEKYRRRFDRIHGRKMMPLQVLALEIHVREELRKQGRLGSVDVQAEFLDLIDWGGTYEENYERMERLLTGEEFAKWPIRNVRGYQ
jgi:hypothetical protein